LTVLCADRNNFDNSFVAALAARGNTSLLERGVSRSRFVGEQRACFDPDLVADAILFPNYFVPPFVPKRLGRVVGVLHDLQYRHFRANFSQTKRLWLRMSHNLMVRRADRLVVISEFVRNDVLHFLGDRWADKLAVIHNPISWDRFASPELHPPLDRPYILSVAAQYAHKNLDVLITAFARVAARHPDVMLVLCGQDFNALRGVSGTRQTIAAMAAALGIGARVHVTGYVDDIALGNWYRHAMLFAFPSIFEGFGMPPVEALGFGLPTIVANRTSLPEVTLGLARLVDDARDSDAWAEALDSALSDIEALRPTEAQIAGLRAHYAPARIAQAYLSVCGGSNSGS
jgi:glycosyltransferase involved in cell wall biosynthesis